MLQSSQQSVPFSLGNVTVDTVKTVRNLNTVIFPVRYSEKFYKELPTLGEYAKLAYAGGKCVGTVSCSKVFSDGANGHKHPAFDLYIMTLGVLAPYRGLGIGTALVSHIMQHARNDRDCKSIYLHVQTTNTDAIKFYERLGFCIREEVADYYRIESPNAYILQLVL
ncbi:N-alpha-acetyltransferase 50 [Sorochytrium milnesiophthora]